jgi:hypothetical protein
MALTAGVRKPAIRGPFLFRFFGLCDLHFDRVVYPVPDVLVERGVMLLTSVLFDFRKDFLLAIPAYLPAAGFGTDISAAEGEFLVPFR